MASTKRNLAWTTLEMVVEMLVGNRIILRMSSFLISPMYRRTVDSRGSSTRSCPWRFRIRKAPTCDRHEAKLPTDGRSSEEIDDRNRIVTPPRFSLLRSDQCMDITSWVLSNASRKNKKGGLRHSLGRFRISTRGYIANPISSS